MHSTPLVRHILRDEAVTRGLGDVEAQMIVGWLANRAEQIAFTASSDSEAWENVRRVCRRARTVAGFVRLWMMPGMRGAALQLVGAERLHWPLPSGDVDPGELMEEILEWIDRQDEIISDSRARRAA
jgi:hypothetical protein